jgi:hypothetical protein
MDVSTTKICLDTSKEYYGSEGVVISQLVSYTILTEKRNCVIHFYTGYTHTVPMRKMLTELENNNMWRGQVRPQVSSVQLS